jgi:hypothetical protein
MDVALVARAAGGGSLPTIQHLRECKVQMSTTTTPSRVEGQDVVALKAPTLGWALRRTLLGIVILVFSIGGAACLLYASIDPDEEAAPSAISPGQVDPSLSTGPRPAPAVAPRRV